MTIRPINAHTDNLDDFGNDCGNLYSNTAWTQVLTVDGADQIEVTVAYQSWNTSYEWGCVWSGSHSEYTAQSNYESSLTGKLGGSTKTTSTFLVDGDTATVGWYTRYSDNYYGMYVTVKAASPAKTRAITSSSTDLEYPSAKAVWDLFNSIVNGNEVSF